MSPKNNTPAADFCRGGWYPLKCVLFTFERILLSIRVCSLSLHVAELVGIIIDFNLIHFLIWRKGRNHLDRLVIVVHNIVYFTRLNMNHLSR